MTNAIASKTSQIKRGDGGDPEVFSAVAEVKSISPSGGGQEFIDVTHLNSSGSYREQLSSFKGNPTISIEVNYIPDQHDDLWNDYDDGTLRNFQYVLSDDSNTTFSFAAYVTSLPPRAAVGEALTGTIELQLSGVITRA